MRRAIKDKKTADTESGIAQEDAVQGHGVVSVPAEVPQPESEGAVSVPAIAEAGARGATATGLDAAAAHGRSSASRSHKPPLCGMAPA